MQNRNPINQNECKEMLGFLDYLRKSQCTKVVFRRNLLNEISLHPKNGQSCNKTLSEMEDTAKECLESSGFRFK